MKIPFYEIYYANILNPTLLDYITYKLYKHNKNNRFNKIIYLLDKIKYKKYKKYNKLIETINLKDPIYVKSELDGYNPVYQIHRTIPFIVYKLILENGCILECADTHLVYSSLNYIELWKYVKDLSINDYILTLFGWSKVKTVIKTNDILYMADMTVNSDTHSLLTNSIVSHNTTTTVNIAAA